MLECLFIADTFCICYVTDIDIIFHFITNTDCTCRIKSTVFFSPLGNPKDHGDLDPFLL